MDDEGRKGEEEEKEEQRRLQGDCRKRRRRGSCSKSSSCCCWRSSHSCSMESGSKSSWSSSSSKSCGSFNGSSSSSGSSWKSCSSSDREAHISHSRCRRKGPGPGKRDCLSMVHQPPRGSVQWGQPPSRPNLGSKMVLWHLLVLCAHQWIPSLRSTARSMVSRGSPRVPLRPTAVGGS